MIKVKIFKHSVFVVALFAVCVTSMGCSTKQEHSTITTQTTERVDSNPVLSVEESKDADGGDSETMPQTSINSTEEREKEINQLKKLAEEDAENDRYNILEALGNTESDYRRDNALTFIKEYYPDYFSSDERLKNSIKYGHYLATLYKDFSDADDGGGKYYKQGEIISEVAQDVYMGIRQPTDESVIEDMQELELLLQFFYDKYYGAKATTIQ